MKTLGIAWLCLVVVACATASRKEAAQSMPQAGGAPPMPAGDPHAQIEELSNRIEAQRQQMSLAPPTAPITPQAAAAPVAVSHTQDATCHPAASATCNDTCTLGDSICDNADKICKIADTLAGDDWAASKCATAKQTCNDAHKRCCECS